jgi:glycosyltransferase involved in cell wall biosynthesis
MTDAAVRSLADASPLAEHIHLVGYRKDVLEIVAACNATVLPAIKREGLPKTVIESMALGVTPIVTDTGGAPELVSHGQTGLVVPPGDARAIAEAILRLERQPDENHRMGAAARRRLAEHFPLEASVAAHLELYRDLAKPTDSLTS